jgi:hypothetical protein
MQTQRIHDNACYQCGRDHEDARLYTVREIAFDTAARREWPALLCPSCREALSGYEHLVIEEA